MNRILSFLLIFLFLIGTVSAEWKSFNDQNNFDLEVKVLSATEHETKIEIVLPGYKEEIVPVNGEKCLRILVPGSHDMERFSFPVLPMIGKMLSISDTAHPEIKILEQDEVEVELQNRIVPSKGHVTRDVDPSTVPYVFGSVYKKDVYYPAEAIKIGKPFIFRDVRGAHVCVVPFRPNHVTMKMKILKRVVLAVICNEPSTENVLYRSRNSMAPSKVFSNLYKSSFINYTPQEAIREDVTLAKEKLVLIYPEIYQSVIKASKWYAKRIKSFDVIEVNLKDIGATAADIQAKLQSLYDESKDAGVKPFSYVILFGDTDTTPTQRGKKEKAASDRVYVRLEGNDNLPDAFISRFSGNEKEIAIQLDKVIAYEDAKADKWLEGAILVGSLQGNPTDKQRLLWIKNGGGNSEHNMPKGLSSFGYNKFTEVYADSSSTQGKADIKASVEAGVSIICYVGHGSKTSWASSGFSNTDIDKLTDNINGTLPVIWSVACVNGDFSSGTACFAEAWLRKNGGAVAMEAASTNESWVPPCVKQVGTLNAMIEKKASTFGALEAAGLTAAFAVYGSEDPTEGNKLAEQCNLFGDCTMEVRYPGK